LGQSRDIERFSYACDRTFERVPDCNGIVLVGISRGSATILNYAAVNKDTPIKAIIAEASFDTLKSVVKHLLKRFHVSWVPFSRKIGMKIADNQFQNLNVRGLFPIDIVANIDKNIPILLVHSRKDAVVPLASSRVLYIRLRTSGHKHVYLLELPLGNHGKLMQSGSNKLYQNVVHAFYKKHKLPHNKDCADKAEHILLAQCKPTIQEVQTRMKKK